MSEHTVNRIGFAILGISLIVLGAAGFVERGFYDHIYRHYFDFGPHHRAVGLLLAGLGIACAYLAFRKRASGQPTSRS